MLVYEKNADGMPTDYIAQVKHSKTARSQLIDAIESKDNLRVMYSPGRGSKGVFGGDMLFLDPFQINEFINNSIDVNPMTLGYGMTFLHEMGHTAFGAYGGWLKDFNADGSNGPNVNFMNSIRRELGPGFGQRFYHARSTWESNMNVIPFSKSTRDLLQSGRGMLYGPRVMTSKDTN